MRIEHAISAAMLVWMLGIPEAQACTQPGYVGFHWAPNSQLSWASDGSVGSLPSGTSSDPFSQISSAFAVWQRYWQYRCPYINIAQVGQGSENVTVYALDLGAGGPGASQPRYGGLIIAQTITINNNPGSLPRFDASQSAYNQYVFKVMLHELGHVFGLDDVNWGATCANHAYSTVMDQICGTNDFAQGISTIVTTCDDAEIGVIYGTCAADASCPSNNGCSGYDAGGYPIRNPDNCEYNPAMGYYDGCPSGTFFQTQGGDPGQGCCWQEGSPILIDLSGDGFVLTDAQNGVMFALDPTDPVKHRYSWTAAGVRNGWLVLDRNGNGAVDSGAELFGNYSQQPASADPNGFRALEVFDNPDQGGNGDGVIDAKDAIYRSLRVWVDLNHNGISEPNELFSLADAGVISLGLDYHESKWTDKYGNQFRYRGRVQLQGVHGDHWMYDVFLRRQR